MYRHKFVLIYKELRKKKNPLIDTLLFIHAQNTQDHLFIFTIISTVIILGHPIILRY